MIRIECYSTCGTITCVHFQQHFIGLQKVKQVQLQKQYIPSVVSSYKCHSRHVCNNNQYWTLKYLVFKNRFVFQTRLFQCLRDVPRCMKIFIFRWTSHGMLDISTLFVNVSAFSDTFLRTNQALKWSGLRNRFVQCSHNSP